MDKKGVENVVADHLSRPFFFYTIEPTPIRDSFLDKHLFVIRQSPWYADIANYLAMGNTPDHWTKQDMSSFFSQVSYFFWDDPYLFKYYTD